MSVVELPLVIQIRSHPSQDAGFIFPLHHGILAKPQEHEPLGTLLFFVGWGWGQQRRSSACAITACTMSNHDLLRLVTN